MSTGISEPDRMPCGAGVFRGSSVLESGSPGTGKSSIGAIFADAACRRGERCLLFAYEEPGAQATRNMRSIGVDLQPWVERGLLQVHASRPTLQGLEQHLVQMYQMVAQFDPAMVVVDPISNLTVDDNERALKATLMRLLDHLKRQQVTAVFTNRSADTGMNQAWTQVGVSSLTDAWLLLSNLEASGERTRALQVLKASGMAHSNRVRQFVLSGRGIELVDVSMSGDRVLTGSARMAQQRAVRRDRP